jgi:hypothetical protein
MAEQDSPQQATRKQKAEGERWSSEPDTVRNADRDENPERLYNEDDGETASGITNRPLPEELDNQASLPDRGTSRVGPPNPDASRAEGDDTESER